MPGVNPGTGYQVELSDGVNSTSASSPCVSYLPLPS